MSNFMFWHFVAIIGVFVLGYLLGGWRTRRVYEVRLEEEYNRVDAPCPVNKIKLIRLITEKRLRSLIISLSTR